MCIPRSVCVCIPRSVCVCICAHVSTRKKATKDVCACVCGVFMPLKGHALLNSVVTTAACAVKGL